MSTLRTSIFSISEALRFRTAFLNTYHQSGMEQLSNFFTHDFSFYEKGIPMGTVGFFLLVSRIPVEEVVFNVSMKAADCGHGVIMVNSYNREQKLIRVFTLVRDNTVEGGCRVKRIECF